VKAGRNDDDMNTLVIAADFTSEKEAKEMVKVFLETKFDEKSRHKRRLQDIEKIEANN
jgi:ribose 5-phosphate isomerase RpiB